MLDRRYDWNFGELNIENGNKFEPEVLMPLNSTSELIALLNQVSRVFADVATRVIRIGNSYRFASTCNPTRQISSSPPFPHINPLELSTR